MNSVFLSMFIHYMFISRSYPYRNYPISKQNINLIHNSSYLSRYLDGISMVFPRRDSKGTSSAMEGLNRSVMLRKMGCTMNVVSWNDRSEEDFSVCQSIQSDN